MNAKKRYFLKNNYTKTIIITIEMVTCRKYKGTKNKNQQKTM